MLVGGVENISLPLFLSLSVCLCVCVSVSLRQTVHHEPVDARSSELLGNDPS